MNRWDFYVLYFFVGFFIVGPVTLAVAIALGVV